MKNRHLTLTLAVALGLVSPSLSAMGLGQLQVKSGLNQPLVAEIPIISATPSELEQLDVRLASPEAFARIGLERPGELTANLQFSVGKNSRGQPVILVTTPDRFSEPLLNFLIEAEWGKGTVTREYTALIDPPYIAAAIVQPMQAPSVAAPVIAAPVATVPEPVLQAAQEPVQEPAPASAPVAEVVSEPEPAPAPVVIAPAPAQVPEPAPAPMEQPAPPAPRPVAANPRPAQPAPKPPAPEPAPAPQPVEAPTPPPSPGQYGPVAPGQTLWNIANSVRSEAAISVNQMMVALLRANPEAFAQDNINRLKQGSVLRVPSQEETARLSATQAAELVNQQASAWRTPRASVPQPVEIATPSENISAKPAVAAAPVRPPRAAASRLEIVPPSGNAAARGAQSGAAAGAGGTELRAELVQAREDLAARTAEVGELKSRVADLEKQDADRQRLIEMQNSQMKALQDRLNQLEQATAPATPVATPVATPAAAPTPAAAEVAVVKPWYLSPFLMGGAVLVLLGGLVLAMRRSKSSPEVESSGGRLSDDEALRASMAKTRQASERIKPEPFVAPVAVAMPVDSELEARVNAVRAKPQDLEAHINLLRLYHARGNAVDYEVAAQAMRGHLASTMDPRWREAVVMGASLMPGNTLFSQAGWNSPRFSEPEVKGPAPVPAPPVPSVPAPAMPPPSVAKPSEPAPALPSFLAASEVKPVKVFEPPIEDHSLEFTTGSPRDANPDREIDFGDQAAVMDETFGDSMRDIHRDEAQLMAEDESSATRIELAKAYLDIGDMDGARSMLEEVLAEGGPAARAEAARLLKDIG